VGFFQVITKNAVTNAQRLERLDIARQSQLVEFQSFDDHVSHPNREPWQIRIDASVLEPALAYFFARTLKA
jgi:hypothetical protein